MRIFNKIKNKNSDDLPIISAQKLRNECNHKFQDFPWYLDYEIITRYYSSENRLTYDLIEPYVCIHCGLRKDKILEHKVIIGKAPEAMNRIIQKIEKQYHDRIKPKPIVEDMINDLQLVDVEHLRWYHYLNGTQDPSTSREQNTISNNIKLKL